MDYREIADGSVSKLYIFIPNLTTLHLFFEDNLTLIFEIYLPFIDHEASIFGYAVTIGSHMVFEIYALMGIGGFDLALLTYIYHVIAMNQLFHYDLKLVEKFLINEDIKNIENHQKVQEMMRNIFISHKDLIQ